MAKIHKFWVDDGQGHRGKCNSKYYCPAMRMALNPVRGKGLDLHCTIDSKTGSPKNYVIYRQHANDPGVLVNFCPFCGAKYSSKELKEKAPSKAARRQGSKE